jgi:hypothetical protein
MLVLAGAAATATLARRPQPEEPLGFGPGQPGAQPHRDGQIASGPHGNGSVSAGHPSATTD